MTNNSDNGWGLGISTLKTAKAINVEFSPIAGNSASEVQTAIANVVSKIATHKIHTDDNLERVQNLENISEQFNVYMNANPILGNDGVDGFNPIKGLHYDDGIDGTNGTDGSDGTHGINGNNGENGYNGYNGVDGANGYNGANGSHGRHGRNGYDGFDGSPGSKGEPGTDGNNGTDGANGIGVDGIDGGVVAQLTVFTRHPFLPPKPIGGSFNFATSTLSPPDEWSPNVTPGWDPVYTSVAISSGVGQSGIDSNIVWSAPILLLSNGDTGSAGKSVFTAIVFNRSPAAPTRPVGGSFNFGSNILIPPNNWYLDMPDGNNPAYGTRFTFSISGDTGLVTAETWGQPFKIAEDGIPGLDGETGADGISTYLVSVFKRASERPDTPVDGLYNFGTNSSQPPAGWADTIPDGNDPLWVSTSIARTQGVTGIDDDLVWAYPTKLSENGKNGEEGRSVYTATVFDRSSSLKSAPSGGSFNFGTNQLVAPIGWFLDVPDGSHPVYATRYAFSVIGDTGSVVAGQWSDPIKLSENGAKGEDGNVGPDGISTYFISVFKRGTSTPSKPFGGSYNFGTNALTAPSGWFDSVPGGSDDIYLSTALASTQGVTGVDSTLTWTTAIKVSEKGATGDAGFDAWPATGAVLVYNNLQGRTSDVNGYGEYHINSGRTSRFDRLTDMIELGYVGNPSAEKQLDNISIGDYVTVTVNGSSEKLSYKITSIVKRFSHTDRYGVNNCYYFKIGLLIEKYTDSIESIDYSLNGPNDVTFDFSRGYAERGAGWWRWQSNYSDTSSLSNNQLIHNFDLATGLSPVAGDKFIILAANGTANAYIRNNTNTDWNTQAAFVDGDMLVDGTITANKITLGFATNKATNSNFTQGLSGWKFYGTEGIGSQSTLWVRPAGDSWAGENYPTLQLYQAGTDTSGYAEIRSMGVVKSGANDNRSFAVTPGNSYIASGKLSLHRCDADLYIYWRESDGTYIPGATYQPIDYEDVLQGSDDNPDSWVRVHVKGTAPNNAAFAQIVFRKKKTDSGSNSRLFLHEPQFEEVNANTTEPGTHMTGGVTYLDGGSIITGSITAASGAIGDLAVDTLQIVDQAVTFPTMTQLNGNYLRSKSSNYFTARTLVVDRAENAKSMIQGFFTLSHSNAAGTSTSRGDYAQGNLIISEQRSGQSEQNIAAISGISCDRFNTPFISLPILRETETAGTYTYRMKVSYEVGSSERMTIILPGISYMDIKK